MECITMDVGPGAPRSLYIEFAVSAMLLTCKGSSSGSASKAAHLRGIFTSSTSASMLGKKKGSRECVLTGFGTFYW